MWQGKLRVRKQIWVLQNSPLSWMLSFYSTSESSKDWMCQSGAQEQGKDMVIPPGKPFSSHYPAAKELPELQVVILPLMALYHFSSGSLTITYGISRYEMHMH